MCEHKLAYNVSGIERLDQGHLYPLGQRRDRPLYLKSGGLQYPGKGELFGPCFDEYT